MDKLWYPVAFSALIMNCGGEVDTGGLTSSGGFDGEFTRGHLLLRVVPPVESQSLTDPCLSLMGFPAAPTEVARAWEGRHSQVLRL